MFTRERPIHLTPEGIDVMVQAAEEHPGLIFLLDSYNPPLGTAARRKQPTVR